MKAIISIDLTDSGSILSEDHFGVVLKQSVVPTLESGVRDWSQIELAIKESGAKSIRYPGGTESWRDFDFTNRSDVEELKAVIDLCARLDLELQFTISLRQFFVDQADARQDGVLEITEQQVAELVNFIKDDLLSYATSQKVEISRIQLDNEPLHRDYDGTFLNHREYGALANFYASVIGGIVSSHEQTPEVVLVTASGEGAYDRNEQPTFEGAWGIRAIINGIAYNDGAGFVSGVDLHMGGLTLHSNYSVFLDEGIGEASNGGNSLQKWLDWQQERWRTDAVMPMNGIGDLNFHVSAWSFPQRENGGASLQNAGLGVMHIHTYSMARIQSATNYTLMGGDANALFSRSGRESPGGSIFGMMADSIIGLRAVNLDLDLSNPNLGDENVIFRAFLNEEIMVLYVINRQPEQQILSVDISSILNSLGYLAGGVASISVETLGVSPDKDPTQPYTGAVVREEGRSTSNLNLEDFQISLNGYEVAEVTLTANYYSLLSGPSSEITSSTTNRIEIFNEESGRHFVDGSGVLNGSRNNDFFLMGNGEGLVIGGQGNDTLSFENSPTNISVWFGIGVVETARGELKFVGIERVDGSAFDDRFVSYESGRFWGHDGDDKFEFFSDEGSVARGGIGDDLFLIYDDAEHFLYGGQGDDEFLAFGGSNEIFGGPGNDEIWLYGSHGNLVHFSGGDGDDVVSFFRGGSDKLVLHNEILDDLNIIHSSTGTVLDFGVNGSIFLRHANNFNFHDDVLLV